MRIVLANRVSGDVIILGRSGRDRVTSARRPIRIRIFLARGPQRPKKSETMAIMAALRTPPRIVDLWEAARNGNFRAAADGAQRALDAQGVAGISRSVELRLIIAFCAMRQGHHGEAGRALEAARETSGRSERPGSLKARVALWRA